jgi:nicotinamidase-related amidase
MMLISSAHSSLLLIDMQERLLPAMADADQVVARSTILLTAAKELSLPITVSEQYPKGLGHTVDALASNNAVVMEKLSFSCWRDETMKERFIGLHEAGRPQVIVAGIEAHVCVLQTCIDMANAGFAVFAVADAMSSRKASSAMLAVERMRGAGIQVVNTEMVIFELLEKAGTTPFKSLSALIK